MSMTSPMRPEADAMHRARAHQTQGMEDYRHD